VVLPEGLAVEGLPPETLQESGAGLYLRRARLEANVLRIERRLEMKAQRVPSASYPAWRDFATEVDRSDDARVRVRETEARD
jgi:hypothetical protein